MVPRPQVIALIGQAYSDNAVGQFGLCTAMSCNSRLLASAATLRDVPDVPSIGYLNAEPGKCI